MIDDVDVKQDGARTPEWILRLLQYQLRATYIQSARLHIESFNRARIRPARFRGIHKAPIPGRPSCYYVLFVRELLKTAEKVVR